MFFSIYFYGEATEPDSIIANSLSEFLDFKKLFCLFSPRLSFFELLVWSTSSKLNSAPRCIGSGSVTAPIAA